MFFVFACLLALGSRAAVADDQPFLTLDTTDIEPQLAHEFEQDLVWTMQPAAAGGLAMESELEYGLRDDLQLAGMFDCGWERSGSGALEFRFTSVGGEAIYRPWTVDWDPLGLGVLLSGSAGPEVRELEGRLLAQKNFLNDRLRVVLNGGWTGEWQHATQSPQGDWSSDSTVEWAAGVAYSITWEFSACLELDSDRSFDGLLFDGKGAQGVGTWYLGPTMQYIAAPLSFSLGFQAQLPWAQGGGAGDVRNGFAAGAGRYRIALRVTRSF